MTSDPGVRSVLATVADHLDRASIPFMVVGSFASTAHGAPRTTMNLDLVIDPTAASLEIFLGCLDADEYYFDPDVARAALRTRGMFNLISMTTAWKVDLIVRKARPFSQAELTRRARQVIAEVEVPTASVEDTILSKLEWAQAGSSERQLADVVAMMRVHADRLDLAYLEHWARELAVEAWWQRARDASAR